MTLLLPPLKNPPILPLPLGLKIETFIYGEGVWSDRQRTFTVVRSMSGITPLREKILKDNFLFGIRFQEGWIFGRVIRQMVFNYAPWHLIDSTGSKIEIDPLSFEQEHTFLDPRNTAKEILYLDDGKNQGMPWFMWGSFGVRPRWIRMYIKYPEGGTHVGKIPNLDPLRPQQGDDFGYIDSSRSPYDDPTDYYEVILPPFTKVGAEYYNTHPERRLTPTLNLMFQIVWFKPISSDLIDDIMNRRVPHRLFTAGHVGYLLPYKLSEYWDLEPVTWD